VRVVYCIDAAVPAVMAVNRAAELAGASQPSIYVWLSYGPRSAFDSPEP
jgi:hypothetical protein